ncbi:MAG: decaprenyl-phosphate phosphoribosyltransferase [Planctomycetes bacterium]|nr:decaprenyl-phosphate phosphoribosyltransferase [Planctomycetota bacterium]
MTRWIRLGRPRQWTKNVLVLLPVIFAQRVADGSAWAYALAAAGAFCLASGAVYAFNDIRDRHSDRLHPRKKDRPIASGLVSVPQAVSFSLLTATAAVALAALLHPLAAGLIVAYLALQMVYALSLKRRMIADVICIAVGFVLRAVTGAVVIDAAPSPWLIVCTFTLCLFLGFCKRRAEVTTMGGRPEAGAYRRTLAGYDPELLTHLITLSAGIAIVSFLLYAVSSETVERFGTVYLAYTLPLVVYAVCRFAMLSMWGRYDDPAELILRDRAFQLSAGAWLAAVLAIIQWGPYIRDWIARTW